MEIPRRRGVSKAQFFKGKYGTKMEFPEGVGGFKLKNLPWEGYGYFLEQHIESLQCNLARFWIAGDFHKLKCNSMES